MDFAHLSLGSNLGNKLNNILLAKEIIGRKIGKIVSKSSIYKTSPWGTDSDNFYLNQVIKIETILTPHELINKILKIEIEVGRIRTNKKWEDRIIDIDILFHSDFIIHSDNLILPHPLLHKRKFVLIPLNEIDKNLMHPILNKSISEILSICSDESSVSLY